jgi:hypothetical protein
LSSEKNKPKFSAEQETGLAIFARGLF